VRLNVILRRRDISAAGFTAPERCLAASIQGSWNMHAQDSGKVLLTGSGGVVGQALLDERPAGDVLGLVRRTIPSGAAIETVRGDLTAPRLGLTAAEYRELCDSIRFVVHSAALTGFSEPADEIMRVNVDGTAAVTRLARDAGVPLLFVSSAFSTLGNQADGTPHAAYVESKKRAEDLVGSSDVASVIVRLSVMLGHAKTGYIRRYQVFHRMMMTILRGKVPLLPADPDGVIDFVSGDWAADSIWSLVDTYGPETPEVVWLTAGPEVTSVRRVLDIWYEFAQRVGLPMEQPRVVSPDMVDRLIRPVLLEELPPRIARLFDGVLQIAGLMTLQHQFPHTSSPPLPPRPSSTEILLSNAAYWAVRSGVTTPEVGWSHRLLAPTGGAR
jgi:nucleoside-diphosphate-sugar epimerase